MFAFGGNANGELGVGGCKKYSTWWVDASRKFGDVEVAAVSNSGAALPAATRDRSTAGSALPVSSLSCESTSHKAQELLLRVQAKVCLALHPHEARRVLTCGEPLYMKEKRVCALDRQVAEARQAPAATSASVATNPLRLPSLDSLPSVPAPSKLAAGGLPATVDYAALPPPKYKAYSAVREKAHCALVPQLLSKFTRRMVRCVAAGANHTLLVAGTQRRLCVSVCLCMTVCLCASL